MYFIYKRVKKKEREKASAKKNESIIEKLSNVKIIGTQRTGLKF